MQRESEFIDMESRQVEFLQIKGYTPKQINLMVQAVPK